MITTRLHFSEWLRERSFRTKTHWLACAMWLVAEALCPFVAATQGPLERHDAMRAKARNTWCMRAPRWGEVRGQC